MFRGEKKLKVKAICIISNHNKIFVSKAFDSANNDYYYRPIGGTVEFGEYAIETLKREIKEELNTDIENVQLIKIIENIFICDGINGHENMFIFSGEFSDKSFYLEKKFMITEDNNEEYIAEWIDINEFSSNRLKLVPDELKKIIEEKYKSGILTTAST